MRHMNGETIEQIKAYIEDYFRQNGYSPSVPQIGEALGLPKTTAYRYIVYMNEHGILSYSRNDISTNLTEKVKTAIHYAGVSGSIPCGTPDEQVEQIDEYIPLPASLVGKGEFFILKAYGDSMIEAGIDSGDLVVIRKQKTAKEGEIVAALLNGAEATLKTLQYDETGRAVLHPENQALEDIRPMTGFEIQGVAVYVLKKIGTIQR